MPGLSPCLQVFEQMMRQASERSIMPPPPPMALGSPGASSAFQAMMPLSTPARRLSSCVVARDGGGEFFAQSPAPGRPASFFRCGARLLSSWTEHFLTEEFKRAG